MVVTCSKAITFGRSPEDSNQLTPADMAFPFAASKGATLAGNLLNAAARLSLQLVAIRVEGMLQRLLDCRPPHRVQHGQFSMGTRGL